MAKRKKVQKDKQRSTKHTHKSKDRVTRTPLKINLYLKNKYLFDYRLYKWSEATFVTEVIMNKNLRNTFLDPHILKTLVTMTIRVTHSNMVC
jgi:hypothetical protein